MLSIKVAIHEVLRDRADLAPPPRPRSRAWAGRNLSGEQRDTDAAALDAHLFLKQDETGALVRQGWRSCSPRRNAFRRLDGSAALNTRRPDTARAS
jgi:hypothetical protein